MYTKSYDVFCVTKTWLNNTIYDSDILPHNYAIHRKDRSSRGGGILVAIKNDIPNKTTSSRHFYTSRIVRLWNALPVEVIDLTKMEFNEVKQS